MKAITLPQPWASLVAIGVKTIETRPFTTAYRGSIAIHAAKTSVPRMHGVHDPYFKTLLESAGLTYTDLPRGIILATARLIDCEIITTTNCPCYPEYAFADFTPGWYAWKLTDIHQLKSPIPVKGHRGLWEFTETDLS